MLKLKKNRTLSVVIAMIMMVGLLAGNINIASANPTQHEVTFHANGGQFADGKTELKKSFDEGTAWNVATAGLESPSKEGYTFLGWSLAPSSTQADLNDAQAGVNKGDTDVYAVYEKKTSSISINFDPNGGEGEPEAVNIEKGTALGNLLPMEGMYKEEHILAGWATTRDAQTPDVTPETVFEQNTTLFAVWEKIEAGADVSVKFDANGGKFSDNSTVKTVEDIKRGTAMGDKFLADEPTSNNASSNPEENKFLGWAASHSATAPDFNKDTVVTGTMIVYAVYGKGVNKDNKNLGIKKDKIQAKTISGTEVGLTFKPFPANELNAGDKVIGYKIYRGTAKNNLEGIGEVNTVTPDAAGNINYKDSKNLEPSKTYLYAVSAIVDREGYKIEGAAEDVIGYWHAGVDAPKMSVKKGKIVVNTTPCSTLEGIKSLAIERANYPKGEFKPVAGAGELAPKSVFTDKTAKAGAYLYRVTVSKEVDGVVYTTKSGVAGAAVLGKVNKKTFRIKIKKKGKSKYVATITWKGVKGAVTFELQKAVAKKANKLKRFKGIRFKKMKAVDKRLKRRTFVKYRVRAVFKYGKTVIKGGWTVSKAFKLK